LQHLHLGQHYYPLEDEPTLFPLNLLESSLLGFWWRNPHHGLDNFHLHLILKQQRHEQRQHPNLFCLCQYFVHFRL